LLSVTGDLAAFLDFQTAEGHADAAGAVGQRIGFAAGAAVVGGHGLAQLLNAAGPQGGVLPLCSGQVAQNLGPHRVGVPVGQGEVGVVALHLRLPVAFQGGENLFQLGAAQYFGATQCSIGHVSFLTFL
jgi:hypothetical protein